MRKTMALAAAFLLGGCLGSAPGHGGDGTGNGNGNGTGTGTGGGTGNPPEPLGCGKQTFPISTTKVAPNIMMVVDESGSMKEPIQGATPPQSKWTALVGAVNQLLGKYSGSAQWGLSVFPHAPANQCSAGSVDIAVGANTTMSILNKLNGMNDNNIGGNTPTDSTLQAMLGSTAGLADATRANYVLLMTDGQPNCGGDAKSVASTIGKLYGQTTSVRTFVVGIGDGAATDPGALNSWADAGHTARAGATKYYQVNTVNDLQTAFADIVNGVASCTYALTMKPADASLVVGYLNGAAVPTDPANGTTYDPGSNSLEFHGTSCDAIKNGGATNVDVIYGCPTGPIP